MLYFKCPTCKTILANKQIELENGLDEICKNTKLSDAQKDEEKGKLLDKLQIKRQCCRIRILYVKQIDIVK